MDLDRPRKPIHPREPVAFRFCKDCNNLLQPRAPMQDYNNVDGGEAKLLQYACRTCDYMETVPGGSRKGACVYSNEVGGKASETAGVTQDVGTDPTLPHADKKCPACPLGSDCVYFQSQQRTAETGMRLYYVCCDCSSVFDSEGTLIKDRYVGTTQARA